MSIEKVRTYLKQFNADNRIIEFATSSATVELAAQAAGCEPARIAKTLSFKLHDDSVILIVTAGDVDMGNGYQAVYGQLKDVPFQAEEYVSAGSVLGYVNEPTKYYTKEGTNLYFALTKDGTPLDPMQYLPSALKGKNNSQ